MPERLVTLKSISVVILIFVEPTLELNLEELLLLANTPTQAVDKHSILIAAQQQLNSHKIDVSTLSKSLDGLVGLKYVERANQGYRITPEGKQRLKYDHASLQILMLHLFKAVSG